MVLAFFPWSGEVVQQNYCVVFLGVSGWQDYLGQLVKKVLHGFVFIGVSGRIVVISYSLRYHFDSLIKLFDISLQN